MALVQDLRKCSASRGRFFHYSLLGMLVKCSKSWSKMKCNDTPCQGNTPTFISKTGVCALTIVLSVFSVMGSLIVVMLFMLFSVYITA